MINYVWTFIILGSFIYSAVFGGIEKATDAFLSGGKTTVDFALSTGMIMVLWSGILNIANSSGLADKISKFLSPVVGLIFRKTKKGSVERKLIASNMSANFLGLSNAATPLGVEAMRELSKASVNNTATNEMCMLAIINCASLQLIPSTLIALRAQYGSSNPSEIIVPIWIVSASTIVFAILAAKFYERRSYHK